MNDADNPVRERPTVEGLKEKGNEAVKNSHFEEAVIHYTHAIKIEPTNFALYSNRSLAFLKIHQYSLALEDANETIKLNPKWPKGYFRKGEIEFATYQFLEAEKSYAQALKLKPNDVQIYETMQNASKAYISDIRADEQIPWLGAGIGIVVGVIIVIADYIFTALPTHPLIMVFMTIAIALIGYIIGKGFRHYVKSQRSLLYEMSKCNTDEEDTDETKGENKTVPRYSKSQARQRYKMGKN